MRLSVSSDRASTTSSQCKLAKLELPVFSSYPLEWQGFWDQFNVAINLNESITDIDRFNYLKRYLSGQALSSISGLSMSSTNYKEAITILQERYGNPQVLISAYMESLLKLGKVKIKDDVKALRKLYNDVENCVHNLQSLKVETRT